ncbi:hypothetical protein NADFUDRAFT_28902, partial [Nadsonia fulvescens var. elongata DSM 6958]
NQNRQNYNQGSNQGRDHTSARSGSQRFPKRDAIIDLSKYENKSIHVKFTGGRQITGILKGYDQLMNLVLDNVVEQLSDPDDANIPSGKERKLGLVVVRGPLLQSIYPEDGTEIIENPFL